MATDTAAPVANEADQPTILVVESDALIRAPLAEYLRQCGYRVLEAIHAGEARILLNAGQTRIDLVFTDAGLPGEENGFALATWVRRHCPGVKVLLTGGIVNAARRAGDVCEDGPTLTKPYGHERVLARIQRLLHQAGRA